MPQQNPNTGMYGMPPNSTMPPNSMMAPNNMMGMNNMQYQQQMGMMNMPQQVEDLFYTELMVWEKYVDISFYTPLTINL